MANDKKTTLSIVVRTVDEATAKIKAINDRLDATTRPIRNFKSALSDLRSKSGLDDVISGFKGVGSAVGDLLGKVAMVGGVAALAVGGLIHIANEYDDLGKKASRLGVGVDFLAGMRDAAERAGVPIDSLDDSLETFSVNLGKAQVGAGRMAAFLPKISTNLHANFGTTLLAQLKAAKDNAAAIDVLADAMSRLKDPSNRAALALATLGDAKLADLFKKGPKGLKELRDHYAALAPGQAAAAAEGTKVADSLREVKGATDGVKAALLVGLGPAIEAVAAKLTKWLTGHQAEIAAWAKNIGEKLPGAIDAVSDAISDALDDIEDFVKSIGGIKTVAIAAVAILLGPLLGAFTTLGVALFTSPFGPFLAGIIAVQLAVTELIKHLDEIKDWFFGDQFKSLQKIGERAKAEHRDATIQELFPSLEDRVEAARKKDAADDAAGDARPPATASAEASIADLRKSPLAMQPASQMQQEPQKAKVIIEARNMPKGTTVTIDPSSTADVDTSTGYHMWGM